MSADSPVRLSVRHFLSDCLSKFACYRTEMAYDLLPAGDKFLDVGCGGGGLVFKAKQKFNEVYGVDIDITKIRSRPPAGNMDAIHFVAANVNNGLPFSDSSYDTVACIATLEHLCDPYSVISEIHRVLNQGGTFILQVANAAWLPLRLNLLIGRQPMTGGHSQNSPEAGWDGGHLHYFTVNSTTELLKSSGFKILSCRCGGIFGKLRSHWVSLLGADIIIKCRKLGQG